MTRGLQAVFSAAHLLGLLTPPGVCCSWNALDLDAPGGWDHSDLPGGETCRLGVPFVCRCSHGGGPSRGRRRRPRGSPEMMLELSIR